MATRPATLGRFELRRMLGKGAQATVWLAHDPRLEREVAVKLMRPGADTVEVGHWLQEARSVSRLTHPHIVPVFEADVHEQQPYLVFEYVAGPTLAEQLRAKGAMPARDAVEMMLGVLDALSAAHAAGVIHRDLKPSNILVDAEGRARVMDFGIAASVDAQHVQQVVGTPGYMSPEATHGLKPAPAMDLFSAALVLAEMLCGRQLLVEKDPFRAMYRVAHEDMAWPKDGAGDADDALRAIVMRSLARDPGQRHADVAAFRKALQEWLVPAADAPAGQAAQPAQSGSGTLEFLLRRMRHKSDFPAMSDSVVRIQRVANSETESLASLSSEILKDVALTNKLLRLVNTAHYTQSGGGSISTVSRAVALIGFAGIRNIALSLVLLEHMHDKGHANQLKEEFLRSLMAGSLANELLPASKDGEEAFIGAMFQNLGRLLTEFYFPDEARQVRKLTGTKGVGGSTMGEHAASISVLGLSFEELGLGIAKAWGFPESLQRCMRRPVGDFPSRPCEKADRMRWIALAANDVTDAMLQAEPGRASSAIAAVAQRYARVLEISPRDMQAAALLAQQRLAGLAQAMSLSVQPGSPVRRLLEQPGGNGTAKTIASDADSLAGHELQATIAIDMTIPLERPAEKPFDQDAAAAMLGAGIQDITNTMVEDFKLNDVLRMILETMLRALGFRRIVFCLRDPKTETLTGRFGMGEDVDSASKQFKVALKPAPGSAPDLFSAVCLKGADTLISDATVPNIAARLPAWYRQQVNAPAFLLLPLLMKGAPFALIYADKAQPGGIELGERELSLLRTLRNQAVMAFKQSR
ncbi:serine/threonine protein kinase [Rhizobacter sp. Root16D2]|uniref:serine/threonine protein kinase n=1 Tax=Rhizobacter sp. Root16D2 TaxID=1736479 RepID=UPI000A6D58D5|nr:serine/threonine protein kinase [Rhizobacter sp. Root16D2]